MDAAPRPLADAFHRGMNLAHLHQRGFGYGSARSAAQGQRLAGLGVSHVALNPFAYQPRLDSPRIEFGGDPTMTDADVEAEVRQLRASGIAVMLKPHLWSPSFWAGKGNNDIRLDAAGWERWFAAYTDYVLHCAAVAQRAGCASLCVGLEYTEASRANPGAWARVAAACRRVYTGPLLYAANWYEEFEIFADWDAFDFIGVDAYFPLQGGSVEQLVASWAEPLDRVERVARGRPVLFAEAGYRSTAGATEQPWASTGGGQDLLVQARGYEALLRAATARDWFRGVYWWKWFTDLPGEDDAFLPADKPAERILAAWYGASSPG